MKDNQAWTVLLVDDDEDDYLLTWIMLSESKGRKIELEWAKSYQEGSKAVRSYPFDAVLVDYDLGKTSGIGFIREHVSEGCPIPFILYTGRGSYDTDMEALEAGATLYLPKTEATPLLLERSIRYAIGHKRTEEALKISEERFSKAFRSSPDGLAITRQADGKIIEVNDSFEKIFGYSRREVVGKSPFELGLYFDPQDRENARSRLQEEGSLRDYELELRAKSGELRQVTISVEAIVVNDEPCYLTSLRDITEQKRARRALWESEERFRVALQHTPIMIFHYDQDLRYTWAFNTHPDFPPDLLIGKTDAELVPEEQGQELTEFKRQVLETGTGTRREITMALSDGQHTFDLSAEPLRDGQGKITGVNAAVMDITGRKQAEEELRILTQAVPQLVWTSRPDGEIDFCNDRWLNYTGLSADEVLGQGWAKALHPEDTFSTNKAWRQAVESGQEYQVEQRLRSAEGEYRWFLTRAFPYRDETGRVVKWYGTCTDIQDQKQIEAALERERELLRRLFDRIPVMIVLYRPNTRVVQLNREFERLTGWTSEEASQVDFMEKCYPEPGYRQTVRTFMESLQEGWMDIEMTRKDGSILQSSWSNIRLSDDTQIGIGIDIRDRKRAEEALKNYAQQLERSNRDLEEFAFVASHDLREPLRKIESFGEHLQASAGSSLNEVERDYLERMQKAAARMRKMVEGLLTLSRAAIQDKPDVPVNVSKVILTVLEDLELSIGQANAKIEMGHLPTIEADPIQIRQLFQNLIGNALKFHRQGIPPVIKIRSKRLPGDFVEITVEDNGIGFDAQHAGKIFQPFVRLHEISGVDGTGIGLAICRKIVERHGGAITASSTPGKGSAFTVTVPLLQKGLVSQSNEAGVPPRERIRSIPTGIK